MVARSDADLRSDRQRLAAALARLLASWYEQHQQADSIDGVTKSVSLEPVMAEALDLGEPSA